MTAHTDALFKVKQASALMRRIEFSQFDFDIVSSEQCYPISISPGQIGYRAGVGGARPPYFIIKAASSAWSEFAKPEPRPGYNDVFAMIECGHAQLEGDVLPFFRHLFFVKGVAAAIFKGDPRL